MLSLAYQTENEIEINEKTYVVDMSYDNIIRLFDLLEDTTIDDLNKIFIGMKMLLDCNVLEEDKSCDMEMLVAAFLTIKTEFIIDKGNGESLLDLQGNPMPQPKSKELYSLTHDADYIYASFVQAYGIDLIEVQGELDWRKFNALLQGLPSDTRFKEVVDIRQRPFATGKGSQKENKNLRDLKNMYALPGHNVEEGE